MSSTFAVSNNMVAHTNLVTRLLMHEFHASKVFFIFPWKFLWEMPIIMKYTGGKYERVLFIIE